LDPDTRHTVLVVDDTPDNLAVMSGLLRDDYRVKVASSGERALQVAAADPPPDLILLDVMMPGLDGHEVLRRLKADGATREIPVIFLTAMNEAEDEQVGLSLGAVDYISKPIRAAIVLARVRNHLQLKAARDALRHQNAWLEREVQRRTAQIATIQDVTIRALASLAETRDNETGNHIRRTQHYVKALAERLRTHPRFAAGLSDETIDLLFKSAPLHDIGKVGIPDRILLKPGPLDADEFEQMKTHAVLGRDAIAQAEQGLGAQTAFLRCAKEIAHSHHEKWDGSGYPQGLKGDAIPLAARLMALADVYDALISRRVYKPAFPHSQARETLLAGRGTHFDPDVVDAFVAIEAEFQAIAARFADA
jgi:putative two-component system response regulator